MIDDIKILTCIWLADVHDFCDALAENVMLANLKVFAQFNALLLASLPQKEFSLIL